MRENKYNKIKITTADSIFYINTNYHLLQWRMSNKANGWNQWIVSYCIWTCLTAISSSPSIQHSSTESSREKNEPFNTSNCRNMFCLVVVYLGQTRRKCFSSSIWFKLQCLHNRCSLCIQDCLCLPFSVPKSWSLSRYFERICLIFWLFN